MGASFICSSRCSGSAFGAWQAAGAECSAASGCLKPAIKLQLLSDSFTGQHQDTTFCLKRLFVSPGVDYLGLVLVVVKNPEKQLFLWDIFLLLSARKQ